jgi:anti-sigma factor RsiW
MTMNLNTPLTEAELHAFVDDQLTPERQREIEALLAQRPEEAQRAQSYRGQKRELHALFDPVLEEAVPQRLLDVARARTPWYARRWVAGIAIALVGGAAGWGLRGALRPDAQVAAPAAVAFAQRAAVAHAVYSPEQRRPVEVDAAHEDQLVTWLSKRMGAPMKPPHLQELGYALEGGRLLPGGQGPVAQFMYRDAAGRRLTLYVSNESVGQTAFRYVREGPINVFYWVDGPFGYAISAETDREALQAVATEVYRQLASR